MALTQKQCAELFSKHNMQYRGMWADVNVMGAIAMAESGGNPTVTDNVNTDGSHDRGLWQINSRWWPGLWEKYNLYDPTSNAKAAAEVYAKQGYDGWSTYKSGRYKEFMPDRGLTAELKKPFDAAGEVGSNMGNVIGKATNAVTQSLMKVTLAGGAIAVALVFIILGTVILMRSPASKVVKSSNPIGKTARVAKKVAG